MEKIWIWGDSIPYNIPGKKKADVMVLRRTPKGVTKLNWIIDIFGGRIAKDAGGLDTFSYMDEIAAGKMSEYFDDVPNLVPFLADGADTAVIVAPGGGFCNQSREGEGYDIARFLNGRGISAFVLEYRMDPYEAPVYYLDMQRAIRYVRHHAASYGLDPGKIGAMGFSAGGYVAGASAILLKDDPVACEGYQPDEVDAENGMADFLGMIYPAAAFDHNPNMMWVFDRQAFSDPAKREDLLKRYSLTEHITKDCPPQFLVYGTKDPLKDIAVYDRKLKEIGADHRSYVLEGASHGFALEHPQYNHWGDAFADWIFEVTGAAKAPEEELVTAFAMAPFPVMPVSQRANNNSQLRVPLNLRGKGIVLKFTNQYGQGVGIIDHAAVAVTKKDGVDIEPIFMDVTVKGRRTISIPAGEEVLSDPVALNIAPGTEIAVNVYCRKKASTVCGVGYLTRSAKAGGKDLALMDFEKKPYSASFERLFNQAPIQNVDYLKSVEVIPADPQERPAVISCFGDSITAQSRWTDPLMRMLYQRFPGKVSVLNYGICGNRLLSDAKENMAMFGPAGLKRVDWDTLRDHGVTHMIMALGGNDIGMGEAKEDGSFSPTAEEYRRGCEELLRMAHERDIKVYALSIYPARWDKKDPGLRNSIRLEYLDVQKEVFDGFIDIEDALKEGECGYKPGYGYDDNCHLREPGGKAVADVVFRFLCDTLMP